MNINQINSAIMHGNFTNDQLDAVLQAVKFAREQIRREVRRELRIGCTVSFISNRNGQKYSGTVDSIKIKNAIVATPMGRYRVPCNMLTVESA
jgi:K+-transporting ATPase A subunit